MQRVLLILLCVVFVTGCARVPREPTAKDEPASEARQEEPRTEVRNAAPDRSPASGQDLLPSADAHRSVVISDHGQEERRITEEVVREGDRAIAVEGGKPYAIWHLRPDGVWRADPMGGGALLRYLPAQLQENLYWKQSSGDAEVWFRLAYKSRRTAPGWQLTMLNRGRMLVYVFRSGMWEAEMHNWAQPAQSFLKVSAGKLADGLSPATERGSVVAWADKEPPAKPAEVQAVSGAEYAAAFVRMVRGANSSVPVRALALDGSAPDEILWGPVTQWTSDPIFAYQADGEILGSFLLKPKSRQRIWLLELRAPSHALIQEYGTPDRAHTITVRTVQPTYGYKPLEQLGNWENTFPHTFTLGSSLALDAAQDTVAVTWQIPALGISRVQVYRVHPSSLELLQTAMLPMAGGAVHPQSPDELLRAAVEVRLHGPLDRLNVFFATPNAANVLLQGLDRRTFLAQACIGAVQADPRQASCGPANGC